MIAAGVAPRMHHPQFLPQHDVLNELYLLLGQWPLQENEVQYRKRSRYA